MRSPTYLRESRVYSPKNLRSTVQKDFYNTIGTDRTSRTVCHPVAIGWIVLQKYFEHFESQAGGDSAR